jgi:hypothetical protein
MSMSEQKMEESLLEIGRGIKACQEQKLQLPTLVLLYSAIDIAAWMTNEDSNAGVGKRFMVWVDQYLLKANPMDCTAADLYAARCGIVHSLTPDSDMSAKGKARLVCYTWGDRNARELQELVKAAKMDDRYVCVQIEELCDAWRGGLRLLMEELDRDPARAGCVHAKAAKFFNMGPSDTLDGLIEAYRHKRYSFHP